VRAHSVAHTGAQLDVLPYQLHGDGRNKQARRLELATTARKKKNVAPRRPSVSSSLLLLLLWLQVRATVCAIVDLPVPAMPSSHKMCWCWPSSLLFSPPPSPLPPLLQAHAMMLGRRANLMHARHGTA
jgi:hypothetical protein